MSIKDIYISSIEEHNKEREQRESTFNGMSANEWAKNSKSVWEDLPFPRSESKVTNQDIIQEEVYEKILCMYSKEGDVVLDPFMERGTSIVSCIHNNRHGIGLEVDEVKFLDAREAILNSLNLLVNCDYDIENLSLSDASSKIENESIQLCMSSFMYTKEESGITYEDYLNKMNLTFKEVYPKIKQGGYVVFIVRDFRDIKNNQPYVECHNDVARLGMENGFVYQDVIIYNHNGQRGLLLQGYPKVFYVNLNHSYVIVLRKIN